MKLGGVVGNNILHYLCKFCNFCAGIAELWPIFEVKWVWLGASLVHVCDMRV